MDALQTEVARKAREMTRREIVIKAVAGAKGLVSQRIEARIGQRANGKVELLAGVAEGDAVVLAGQARLMRADGQALRVVDLDRPGGRPAAAASRPGGPASGPAATGTAMPRSASSAV